MIRPFAALSFVLALSPAPLVHGADAAFQPRAEHVLLVTWDGMRPDFITPENTPNLYALSQRGTYFARNHSFWVTTTEVNGTVLATGTFPSRSTVVANREYRPDIDPRGPVATEAAETIRKGDELTGGHYLGTATVAELARKAGFPTVIAGTKPVALLHDRASERPESPRSVTLFAGKTYPTSFLAPITEALGPFPVYKPDFKNPQPNTAGNLWTTRALLEHLWKDSLPRYTVLWLSDPDFPQHVSSPGHAAALAGIHDSDTNLGLVIAELKRRGELDKTDIFVVSDHGFSTVGRQVDPFAWYASHGVNVAHAFAAPPQPGEVIAVTLGGTSLLYVIGHDHAMTAKLVEILQASDFAGPIFTREALPGTFPLAETHLDSPAAADIVFSFRWSPDASANGTPGLIDSENKTGSGMHGTLSPFDIHNTLVAAGPDIRSGFRDEFPTGNIDVAPTLLRLLGLDPSDRDGRVLSEAFVGAPAPADKPATQRETATVKLPDGTTREQYLQLTTFAGRTYFDEGNASSASLPAPPAANPK